MRQEDAGERVSLADCHHRRALPLFLAACENGPRPCPFVSCRHHLYLDVNPRTGSLKINFPDVPPTRLERLPYTCSLDAAEDVRAAGAPASLQRVGRWLNLTASAVLRIERIAVARRQKGENGK